MATDLSPTNSLYHLADQFNLSEDDVRVMMNISMDIAAVIPRKLPEIAQNNTGLIKMMSFMAGLAASDQRYDLIPTAVWFTFYLGSLSTDQRNELLGPKLAAFFEDVQREESGSDNVKAN